MHYAYESNVKHGIIFFKFGFCLQHILIVAENSTHSFVFFNKFDLYFFSEMDKLKRVLSGNDETSSNDENRGIMGDVGVPKSN